MPMEPIVAAVFIFLLLIFSVVYVLHRSIDPSIWIRVSIKILIMSHYLELLTSLELKKIQPIVSQYHVMEMTMLEYNTQLDITYILIHCYAFCQAMTYHMSSHDFFIFCQNIFHNGSNHAHLISSVLLFYANLVKLKIA